MAERLRHIFGLDLRSLAALRVALGLLLLVDLANRATDLFAHYTDAGLMPCDAARHYFGDSWRWSLHWLSGSAAWQIVLFSLAAILAACLTLGFFTRLSTLLSWILLVSLHNRNPLVINGGDTLLSMLLLWSVFLPLGAVFSLDARRRGPCETKVSHLSVGSVALILQICLVYWMTGLFKWNERWLSGEAMGQIMAFDSYARPLATTMLGHPDLLRWISWFTLALELGGPLLLFSPWRTGAVRLMVIGAFALLHLGIEATMTVGQFTWVSLAAWSVLLPAGFWDSLGCLRKKRNANSREALSPNKHDKDENDENVGEKSAGIATAAPALQLQRPLTPPALRRAGWIGSQIVAAALLVYVAAWNVLTLPIWPRHLQGTVPVPLALERGSEALSLYQRWKMFCRPPRIDGWNVVVVHLEDGRAVDPIDESPMNDWSKWRRPESIIAQSKNHRWRKYRQNLVSMDARRTEPFRRHYCEYLVRQWDAQRPDGPRIATLEWYFMQETAPANDVPDAPVRQRLVYRLRLSEPPMPDYIRQALESLEPFPEDDENAADEANMIDANHDPADKRNDPTGKRNAQ